MSFLYFLEGLRNPVLDAVFSFLTLFGEETLFLVAALTIFWCVDKRQGYFVMLTGFVGTILNQFLKILCRIPRPWVQDPGFTIVESAREAAAGYSFPSGHTQSSIGLYGGLACWYKKPAVRWTLIALAVLVPFSRMYLGVHFPSDVLVSAGIALVLIALFYKAVHKWDIRDPAMGWMLFGVCLMAAAHVCYVTFGSFPADVDPANMASAVKNAYSLLGASLGILTAWACDRKHPFDTRAPLPGQIAKVVLGLALAMAVRLVLKAPLNALLGGHPLANSLRYYALVLTAGVVWPRTFPRFARLGRKKD